MGVRLFRMSIGFSCRDGCSLNESYDPTAPGSKGGAGLQVTIVTDRRAQALIRQGDGHRVQTGKSGRSVPGCLMPVNDTCPANRTPVYR
jgi:hypothetical protein